MLPSQKCLASLSSMAKDHVNVFMEKAQCKAIGKDIIFGRGKYKGRRGQCVGIAFDSSYGLVFHAEPYRLDNKGEILYDEELLNTHIDARTYWPLDDLEFID
jgi:hypothetical protein